MTKLNDEKGAAVKFPPPLIYLSFILAASAIHYSWPISVPSPVGYKLLGAVVILVGLAIVFAASRTFKKVDTNIEPWKPTSKIVNDGVFAFSRNPIYVAFCLVPIGIGLIVGSFWVLISS